MYDMGAGTLLVSYCIFKDFNIIMHLFFIVFVL